MYAHKLNYNIRKITENAIKVLRFKLSIDVLLSQKMALQWGNHSLELALRVPNKSFGTYRIEDSVESRGNRPATVTLEKR